MNKKTNSATNNISGEAVPAAVPGQEIKRPYAGPSVQTREAEALSDVLANVRAATGFVQP